jgi:O-methyltransferase domain/Dimerisation domain
MPHQDHNESSTLSPRLRLRNLIAGYFVSSAIHAAAQLDIARLLADGPKSCEALALATHANADALYRLLRALASQDIFAEDAQRRFSNTELSELLRSDVPGSMRPTARFFGDEMMFLPWQSLLHSVMTGEAAFEHVYGTNHFDYLSQRPEKAKIFDDAMVSLSAIVNAAIVEAYDFSGFRTLVDIAGGYGSTLCAFLKATPGLRGVLFDLPHVIDGARRYIAEQGMAQRCEAVAGDFFQTVPPGADAYFMKHIIHDWDDDRCVRILRNCHAAMPSHGKLLVSERVVPAGNVPSYVKLGDLVMLVMNPGGRERTEQQYRELFAAGGFELQRLVPTASEHAVLEAVKA